MAIEVHALNVVVILLITLIILFVVFDTIKRIKGQFHRGWRVLFIAMSMFFVIELIELLGVLGYIEAELFGEVLEIIFIIVLFLSVLIINKKIKESHDGKKKPKTKKK